MSIQTEELRFAGHGGDSLAGLLCVPASDEAVVPGVVLVHGVYGVDAHLRDVASRFAAEGFAVLVPDLYSREGLPGPASTPEDPAPAWDAETIQSAVAGLPDRRSLADLEAAARALGDRERVDARSVAAVGFCMGGTLAFMLGCTSMHVAAIVDFYGGPLYRELSQNKPIQPLELALNLDRPLLAFFGEADAHIPLEQVELLRQKLDQSGKTYELVTYPEAAHGFFDDRRPHYHAESARDAWTRTLGFLRETL